MVSLAVRVLLLMVEEALTMMPSVVVGVRQPLVICQFWKRDRALHGIVTAGDSGEKRAVVGSFEEAT